MAANPEELQTLSEAAEQVATDAADAGAPAPAVASKRKRGSALEAARNKVEALVTKVDDAASKVLTLENARGPRSKAKTEAIAKQQAKVDKHQRELDLARIDLVTKEDNAALAAQAKAAKEEAARQKAEESRALTELGVIKLVEIRIGYQSRFDNSSDKHDSVWAHVAKDFNKLVDKNVLPESDRRALCSHLLPSASPFSTPFSPCRRESAALQKRFAHEHGEFRLWCSTANRAVELSGVPADDVEELVAAHRRPTTTIFRRLATPSHPSPLPLILLPRLDPRIGPGPSLDLDPHWTWTLIGPGPPQAQLRGAPHVGAPPHHRRRERHAGRARERVGQEGLREQEAGARRRWQESGASRGRRGAARVDSFEPHRVQSQRRDGALQPVAIGTTCACGGLRGIRGPPRRRRDAARRRGRSQHSGGG